MVDLLGQPVGAGMVGDEDQPVGMAGPHQVKIGEFAFRRVQRRIKRQCQPHVACFGLDGAYQRGKERAGDVGNDQGDRVRPPEAQAPRMGIGRIVQRADRRIDQGRGPFGQFQRAVQIA